MHPITSVAFAPNGRAVRILDQRELPLREVHRDLETLDEIVDAIRTLAVRGAPAIGVAAAMGLVVALEHDSKSEGAVARSLLAGHALKLIEARPTAVNLAWAVERMLNRATHASDTELLDVLRFEANSLAAEDRAMCLRIGEFGLPLLEDNSRTSQPHTTTRRVLTHCNAGALATAGIGTALAPIYRAHDKGIALEVYACETRPLRQGARLTAWELSRAGIPVKVLPDSAAASLLADGRADVVIVGADRVARNGDVANKVGTYALALAARAHDVPFYVALPWSTVDAGTESGASIPIEFRSAGELGDLPDQVSVWNPAFDITPASLVSAYITDRGCFTPEALRQMLAT